MVPAILTHVKCRWLERGTTVTLFSVVLYILTLVSNPLPLSAQGRPGPDLEVHGNWYIAPSELPSANPLDPTPVNVQSDPGQVRLTIRNVGGPGDSWQVYVRRGGGDWTPGVTLEVRRSDNGSGGTLHGDGSRYIPVTLIDLPFFQGRGDPRDIGLQFRVRSTDPLPAGNYHVDLVYTIVRLD